MPTAASVVVRVPEWVSPYVGRPFESRARGPAAFDCWGLCRAVYATRYGIELPIWDDYSASDDRPAVGAVVARERRLFDPVTEPREGDLVLFRVAGHLSHVGVFLGWPWFLHARRGGCSAIERVDSIAWRHRLEGFYRWAP